MSGFLRKELDKHIPKSRRELFDQDRNICLGYGINLTDEEPENASTEIPEQEVWLSPKERAGHTLVIGTTGSGKTVLLSNLVKQDIISGNRLIYVDPKGDTDLLKNAVAWSKLAGRFDPDTFMFLSPMYPQYSIELNPLWGLAPDEAAVVLVSSIPDGKEPFFKKVAFMTLLSILFAMKAQSYNDHDYPSIAEVAEYFTHAQLSILHDRVLTIAQFIRDPYSREKMIEDAREEARQGTEGIKRTRIDNKGQEVALSKKEIEEAEAKAAWGVEKVKTLEALQRRAQLDATDPGNIKSFETHAADARLILEHLTAADKTYFEKVSMTLKAEIDVLTTGAIGELIGRAKTNRLVENLIADKDVIFFAYLGALRFGDEIVGRASKMIFSSIQRLAGQMYQKFQKFDPPLAVYGDEAKNLFYDGIEDLFNKVRGARIMLTFATQAYGDIVQALGEDKAGAIAGNTNTQIFMRASDIATMNFVEKTCGDTHVYRPNFIQHQLGLNQEKRKRIPGPFLRQLKTGSFYTSLYGTWYRLYTPYEPVPEGLDFDPEAIFFSEAPRQ